MKESVFFDAIVLSEFSLLSHRKFMAPCFPIWRITINRSGDTRHTLGSFDRFSFSRDAQLNPLLTTVRYSVVSKFLCYNRIRTKRNPLAPKIDKLSFLSFIVRPFSTEKQEISFDLPLASDCLKENAAWRATRLNCYISWFSGAKNNYY